MAALDGEAAAAQMRLNDVVATHRRWMHLPDPGVRVPLRNLLLQLPFGIGPNTRMPAPPICAQPSAQAVGRLA
jgi:hypothetical protein